MTDKIYIEFFLFFIFLNSGCLLDNSVQAKTGNTTGGADFDFVNGTAKRAFYTIEKDPNITCVIEPIDPLLRDTLRTLTSGGSKLIEFSLQFEDHQGPVMGENNATVFRPFRWVRTSGRHGRGLLLMRYDFEILSLSALSYGVEKLQVKLKQTPSKCLTRLHVTEVEKHLVELLLNDFQSQYGTTGSFSETEHICNLHIRNDNGRADFQYTCCHRDPDGNTVCSKLENDIWINILYVIIVIIKIFVIMYCPLLVPGSSYRLKFGTTMYTYRLKDALTITVAKKKLSAADCKTMKEKDKVISASNFDEMPKFRKLMKEMKDGVPYPLVLKSTSVQVKLNRLVPENDPPVGIIKTIYEQIFRCKIHEKKSIQGCCESSIFGPNNPFKYKYPWYKCLRELMRGVLLFIVALPWLVRIYIYFMYEDDETLDRNYAASARSLDPEFVGSVTLYLTPVHILFMVCYLILAVDGVVVGVLRKAVREKFKSILRKCFRDMREMSKARACGWSAQLMLLPFEQCGVMGFVVIGLYWIPALPVIMCVLAFYWLPTLNLSVRLLAHLIAYLVPYGKESPCLHPIFKFGKLVYKTFNLKIIGEKEKLVERPEKITMKYRCLQLFVIFICLISMYSVVFLVMECISFFVEVGIYTLIGIILNASHTLKYVSLLFMLVLYGRDCFSSVGNIYLSFNQKIHEYVMKKVIEEVKAVTKLCELEQENTAFRIERPDCVKDEEKGNTDEKSVQVPDENAVEATNGDNGHTTDKKTDVTADTRYEARLKLKEGVPKWEIPRLLLFLDKKDTPYITKKFFFETCYMPHFGCPGSLYVNLFKALSSLVCIVFFLLFVLFVVMAFSEDYSISGTNQMLATLAGGLLPWLFRNILFKKPAKVTLDTGNLNFQNCLDKVLKESKQSWPIADIETKIGKDDTNETPTKKGKEFRRFKYRSDGITGSQIYESMDFDELPEGLPILDEEENENVDQDKEQHDLSKVDMIINTAKSTPDIDVYDV